MKKRLVVTLVLLLLVAFGLFVRSKKRAATSKTTTLLLFEDKRTLSASRGEETIRVYSVRKDSTGYLDTTDIRSTRVELSRSGTSPETLLLPVSVDLAATAVQFADLSGSGPKELLLFKDSDKVAVVSLSAGGLTFRPELDVLKSWAFELGPVELGNTITAFVAASSFPQGGTETVPLPQLYIWTQEHGFTNVTRQFPDYVRQHLIPRLTEMQNAEPSPSRRALFERVMQQLKRDPNEPSGSPPVGGPFR